MSEFMHLIIGGTIILVLIHGFVKPYFITEKDLERWQEIIDKYFSN